LVFLVPLILVPACRQWSHQASHHPHAECTLQQLDVPGRPQSLRLVGTCAVTSEPWVDVGAHQIRDVTVRLIRSDADYNAHHCIFERTAAGPWRTPRTSMLPPLWNNQVVMSQDCILPTARVWLADDDLMLAYFDGKSCQFFMVAKPWDGDFQSVDLKAEPYRSRIRSFYRTAFSTSDVYWDYCLVTCAEQFGFQSGPVDFGGTVDVAKLHALWTAATEESH
jgi:hypothetical protein